LEIQLSRREVGIPLICLNPPHICVRLKERPGFPRTQQDYNMRFGDPYLGLRQAQKCGRVRPVPTLLINSTNVNKEN
jgi:hypothetical protein